MPKGKSARLSLSLPGPLDANGQATGASPRARKNSYDWAPNIGSKGTPNMNEEQVSQDRRGAETPVENDELPVEPRSPQITSLPAIPVSPGRSPHSRGQSGSIFSNMKAAKSSAKIPGSATSSQPGSASASVHEGPHKTEGRKRSTAGLLIETNGGSSQEDLQSPIIGKPPASCVVSLNIANVAR